jgi:hypothetical protein
MRVLGVWEANRFDAPGVSRVLNWLLFGRLVTHILKLQLSLVGALKRNRAAHAFQRKQHESKILAVTIDHASVA